MVNTEINDVCESLVCMIITNTGSNHEQMTWFTPHSKLQGYYEIPDSDLMPLYLSTLPSATPTQWIIMCQLLVLTTNLQWMPINFQKVKNIWILLILQIVSIVLKYFFVYTSLSKRIDLVWTTPGTVKAKSVKLAVTWNSPTFFPKEFFWLKKYHHFSEYNPQSHNYMALV